MWQNVTRSILRQTEWRLHINWAHLLAATFFWTYGFFGAIRLSSPVATVALLLALAGVFIFFLCVAEGQPTAVVSSITIRRSDLLTAISYAALTLALSAGLLRLPLTGDELYHAQQSGVHAAQLGQYISIAPHLINVGLLFGGLISLLSIKRWLPKKYRWLFFGVVFLLCRAAVLYVGGFGDPHPPLRLLPEWLFSNLLSGGEIGFRIGGVLCLAAFAAITARYLRHHIGIATSWLAGAVIATIPILWHTGIVVEASIWSGALLGLLLIGLYEQEMRGESGETSWFMWFTIAAVASQFRLAGLIGFVPLIALLFLRRHQSKNKLSQTETLLILSPILAALPLIIYSSIVGTPATYIPAESSYFLGASTALERVWFALESGIVFQNTLQIVLLPWLLAGAVGLLATIMHFRIWIANTLFWFAGVYLFYSIRPVLWGNSRYQAEFFIPLAVLGLYLCLRHLGVATYYRKVLATTLLVLFAFNLWVAVGPGEYLAMQRKINYPAAR